MALPYAASGPKLHRTWSPAHRAVRAQSELMRYLLSSDRQLLTTLP